MFDTAKIKEEYELILNQLSDPELISDWPSSVKATAGREKFETLLKRKGLLEKILETEKEIQNLKNKIEENKAIISGREDKELTSLAETEIVQLREQEKKLENELKDLIGQAESRPKTENEYAASQKGKAVIIEIRAGAGGKEAALFAADLFRMYSKYGQSKGWEQKVLDSRPTELNGFKEIIFEMKGALGADVFSKMRHEGGVHRIQRIPTTEKSGRIHTSTASVAVLPKPGKTEIKIKPDELKIDLYRSSGPGGQYVNRRETAVRITHLPTGIVVTSQTERSQLQNKENALAILQARILEKQTAQEAQSIGGKRRSQIGGAKRAEKIRTYNFPQDRLTDHRIKKSWRHLEEIMQGKLDPVIESLLREIA